ncbi:MAG TPA: hypothetical protein DCP63_10045 [Bacteroidetes bacterium]|nr:hypothetical protein [Bacteroidota bacterium]
MEEQAAQQPTASLGDLIINVFSSPSDAFAGLRNTPARGSVWIIPMLITILLTAGFTYVMFSNETLKEQALEAQRKAIEERVASGSMSQADADRAAEGMEQMGGMIMVIAMVSAVVVMAVVFFAAALVLWLAGKLVLKSPAGYAKYLEVYGLSNWIGSLGLIVTILMAVAMNSLYATPSLGLAVFSEYDSANTLHRVLSAINVFGAWQMIIVGIGMSKLSDKSTGMGIGLAAVLWVIWIAIAVALGFAR